MYGDEYRKMRADILEEIKCARFILPISVDQKTKRASKLVYWHDDI